MTRTRTIDPALAWAPALMVSVLVHAMMVATVQWALAPEPIPFTEQIKTRIEVSSLNVPAHRAQARDAEGEAAETLATSGERVGVRTVPSSRAQPVEPVSQSLPPQAPQGAVARTERPEGEAMRASQFVGSWLPASSVAGPTIPSTAVVSQDMAVVDSLSAPVAATLPTGMAVSVAAPAAETIPSARPWTTALAASDTQGRLLEAARASALSMEPAAPPAEVLAAAESRGPAISTADLPTMTMVAAAAPAQTVAAAESRGPALAIADLPTTRMVAAAAPAQTVAAAESRGLALATAALPTTTMVVAAAPAQTLASEPPQGLGTASVRAEFDRLDTVTTTGQAVAEIAPAGAPAVVADPEAIQLGPSSAAAVAGVVAPTSVATAAVATKATIAWSGAANTVLDEKSMAAIQSFMQPGEITQSASFAGSVRDGIGTALAQFPCSRLQAAFQPEIGGLEVRGHVPVPAMQAQVVEMLQQSVGGAIPIGGSVLVLPPPQCGVLDAVERLGIPQSKDQENDPLEVGEEAQAEILRFEEGQKVVFSLQAPEFDAHIYLDYYDKDGNVLHVLPNQYIEDNRHHANARFAIGDSEGGGANLKMRVEPPFGQDIAVVLGATRSLYDGLRPLLEEGAGYLSWLHSRIRELRLEDPDFRAEWVYLFVRTGPRGAFFQP